MPPTHILLFTSALLFLSFMISPASTNAQQKTCPGSPPTRLIVGDFARVTAGTSNNVRDEATTSGEKIGEIPGKGIIQVLEGPVCADGYTWYRIFYHNLSLDETMTGWTVETSGSQYAIEPYLLTMKNTVGYPRITFTASSSNAPEEYELTISEAGSYTYSGLVPEQLVVFGHIGGSTSVYIYTREAHERLYGRAGRSGMTFDQLFDTDTDSAALTKEDLPSRWWPTATDLFSQVAFIDFEGGRGVRHIGYYTQNGAPVDPTELDYIFKGFTDDYYIEAHMKVSTAIIEAKDPNYPDESTYGTEAYEAHISERKAVLDAAPPSDFTPDLAVLDAIFASMVIESGHDAPEIIFVEETSATPEVTPEETEAVK